MAIRDRGLAVHCVFLAATLGACEGGQPSPSASALASVENPPAPCGATSGRTGQRDTTFGTNGAARVRFGADDDGGFFSLDLAKGEIVAAGWGLGGLGGIRMRLARLDARGALDASFGPNGAVLTSFAASTADAVYVASVGHQRAGGLVAMGYRDAFHAESANLALVRYTRNGALDTTFGANGKSLIDLGGREEIRQGLVLPDDSLLLVGLRDDALLVARVTPSGALDTSFAAPNGYLAVKVGTSSAARGVTLDSAGRILVTGAAQNGATQDLMLIRANANGTLDPSFGEGGTLVLSNPQGDERGVSIATTPEGTIVVAGDAEAAGKRTLLVRRFEANGAPDPTFGASGVAEQAPTTGSASAESMLVLPGGGILVAANSQEKPLLARYTCAGALDATFGAEGLLAVDMGEFGVLHALALDGPDKVLLAGADVGATPGPGTYGVVMRLWL